MAPGNRFSEFFRKSSRGVRKGSSPNEIRVEDGNGAALAEHLQDKTKGIGDLSGFTVEDLKNLFRKCFYDGVPK